MIKRVSAATDAATGSAGAKSSDELGIVKLLKQLRLPGVDINALIESQRKDIEALSIASQQARDGYLSLAQKQTELLNAAMMQLQSLVKEGTTSAAERTEQAKSALNSALGNMRELAEISRRSHEQAFSTISERVRERMASLLEKR